MEGTGYESDSDSGREQSICSIESGCTAKRSTANSLAPKDHSDHNSTQHESQRHLFTYVRCQPRTVGAGMTDAKQALSRACNLYVGTLLDGLSPAFFCESEAARRNGPGIIPQNDQIGFKGDYIKVITNSSSRTGLLFIPNITIMRPESLSFFKRKMNGTDLQYFSDMERGNQISLMTGARLSPDYEI